MRRLLRLSKQALTLQSNVKASFDAPIQCCCVTSVSRLIQCGVEIFHTDPSLTGHVAYQVLTKRLFRAIHGHFE